MGIYRISRSVIVDALQCKEAKTIASDLGFINVNQGEWVVCGEGGETYIVDDAYFQRTFARVEDKPRIPSTTRTGLQIPTPHTTIPTISSRSCARRAGQRPASRLAGRRRVRDSS